MASGTNQYFRRDRLEPKQAENQITFGKKLIRKTLHNDFFITNSVLINDSLIEIVIFNQFEIEAWKPKDKIHN